MALSLFGGGNSALKFLLAIPILLVSKVLSATEALLFTGDGEGARKALLFKRGLCSRIPPSLCRCALESFGAL